MDTFREFAGNVQDNVKEHLQGLDNAELGMVFRDGLDELHEIADQSVPIYNQSIVNVCLDGSLLHEEPEIEGAITPLQMMQYVLYDAAIREGYVAFEAFKEDDVDEAERFRAFLDDYGRPEDLEDCEEAYVRFDSARDTIESETYEEVYEDWRENNP